MYSHKLFPWSPALATVAVAVALFAASPASAQFGTNLVVNGSAEAGPGDERGNAVGSIPGWEIVSAPTVVTYANSAGFPLATSPGPSGRGAQFFAGGWSASSSMYQFIDVSFAAAAIDAKSAIFDLSAWTGGYYGANDSATVQIICYTEAWGYTGICTLPLVNAAARQNVTGMLLRQASGVVPPGTRRIGYYVYFNRSAGSYNDGYADNLYLALRDAGE